MLQFLRPPDPVFHAIVEEALRTAHLFVTETVLAEDELDAWSARYPKTARCLDPISAAGYYARLLEAHVSSTVWRYTDLQALVLWEALSVFASLHADLVTRFPHDLARHRVGPFTLRIIDHGWIETLFFHDTDFLDAADLSILTPDLARTLGWSDSARRAALGLPAIESDAELIPLTKGETALWQQQALRPLDPGTPITSYPVWPEVCAHGR